MAGCSSNTNTLLVAGMMTIVGFQVIFFGLSPKLYCVARGLLPDNPQLRRGVGLVLLERGIVAGSSSRRRPGLSRGGDTEMAGRGLWHHLLPESLRLGHPAVTCMMLGVQTLFSKLLS